MGGQQLLESQGAKKNGKSLPRTHIWNSVLSLLMGYFFLLFFFLSVKKNTDNWLYDCWDIFNYIFPFWLQGDGICSSESKGM